MSFFEKSRMKAAAMERGHGRGRLFEQYQHSKKGTEMGEKFMMLDIIADSIPNDCIQCNSLHHMIFFFEDHPH